MANILDKQAKLLGLSDWTYLPLPIIAQHYLDTYFNELLVKKPHAVLYNVSRATRAKRARGENPPVVSTIEEVREVANEKHIHS